MRGGAHERQRVLQFGEQDLEHPLDTGGAVDRQAPQGRTADQHRTRA